MTKAGAQVAGKRATIKDVAQAADVSPMTVSNVINNRLQFVSAETKKRVEREIERLNYRRQAAARSLRVAEQRSIGMIVIDDSPAFLADFFTCQVVAGLANVLNGADYTLTVQGMSGRALERSMIMRTFEVAGFCAMLSGSTEERNGVLRRLHGLGQPLVVFQQEVAGGDESLCSIRQDDRGGGRLIGDHLLARGVEDILVVVPRRGWPAVDGRVQGLRDSLAANGGSVRLRIVESRSESFADVQGAVAAELAVGDMPGAVIGANDQMALAAMLLLSDRGIRAPGDIRIVGFNGFEAHRYLRPRLTTVASPAYALGERAGEVMLDRLRNGSFAARDIVLPVHFEFGETT